MVVATFDTLKYANSLKQAGVPEKQAEAQAAILADALAVNLKDLATKDDLQELRAATKTDIQQLHTELKTDIQQLRTELKTDIQQLRTELKTDIQQLRTELKTDIRETEQRLNAKIDLLRAELIGRFDGEIKVLKWMMGATLSLLVAVLVRLFFFRLQ